MRDNINYWPLLFVPILPFMIPILLVSVPLLAGPIYLAVIIFDDYFDG